MLKHRQRLRKLQQRHDTRGPENFKGDSKVLKGKRNNKLTSKFLPYGSPDEEGEVYKERDEEHDFVLPGVDGVEHTDQHVDGAGEDPEHRDEDSLGLEDPGQPESQAGEQVEHDL